MLLQLKSSQVFYLHGTKTCSLCSWKLEENISVMWVNSCYSSSLVWKCTCSLLVSMNLLFFRKSIHTQKKKRRRRRGRGSRFSNYHPLYIYIYIYPHTASMLKTHSSHCHICIPFLCVIIISCTKGRQDLHIQVCV